MERDFQATKNTVASALLWEQLPWGREVKL